jgi:hypothetical protein
MIDDELDNNLIDTLTCIERPILRLSLSLLKNGYRLW